jgi:hypothetical protein
LVLAQSWHGHVPDVRAEGKRPGTPIGCRPGRRRRRKDALPWRCTRMSRCSNAPLRPQAVSPRNLLKEKGGLNLWV